MHIPTRTWDNIFTVILRDGVMGFLGSIFNSASFSGFGGLSFGGGHVSLGLDGGNSLSRLFTQASAGGAGSLGGGSYGFQADIGNILNGISRMLFGR